MSSRNETEDQKSLPGQEEDQKIKVIKGKARNLYCKNNFPLTEKIREKKRPISQQIER